MYPQMSSKGPKTGGRVLFYPYSIVIFAEVSKSDTFCRQRLFFKAVN